jgi:hypothetical protein
MLDALLTIHINGKPWSAFDPARAVIRWYSDKPRRLKLQQPDAVKAAVAEKAGEGTY